MPSHWTLQRPLPYQTNLQSRAVRVFLYLDIAPPTSNYRTSRVKWRATLTPKKALLGRENPLGTLLVELPQQPCDLGVDISRPVMSSSQRAEDI